MGKANLSEWSSFRDASKTNGWSARAGQCRNPYALGFSPGESSNGAAASVAAGFAAGAVGTETFGSAVLPSSICGVVGLKPTLGLTSRSGVIPISFSRDVTAPIGRCVADVATLLGGMVGVDPFDEATVASDGRYRSDYRPFLDPDGLRGARIGVWRARSYFGITERSQEVFESVVPVLRELGATVVDPVTMPFMEASVGNHVGVMIDEFRHGIRRYLAGLSNTTMRTLADLIAFNEANADAEMPWFGQGMFTTANDVPLTLTSPAYLKELRVSRRAGRRGFAEVMGEHRLDALFAPTWRESWAIDLVNHDPPWSPGAAGPSNAAGYPHITVPAGWVGELPVGASFLGRAWEEPKLLRYAFAFEQAVGARRPPRFLQDYGIADFVER